MFTKISGSLSRQIKALELLKSLMEEEFSLLISNQVDKITSLELSIHGLLRQIADEKEQVIANLGGGKVLDFAQMLPKDQQSEIQELYKTVDKREQACARQASFNAEISVALVRQGEQLIKELTKVVSPKKQPTYGKKGAYVNNTRPDAVLISGRL